VAIAGVGNAASALVQGVYYYAGREDEAIGVRSPILGGYRIGDIEFVAAFDVSTLKVGRDLAEAIFQPPNITPRFAELPKRLGVEVKPGPVLDGVAPHMVDRFRPHSLDVDLGSVVDTLKESQADILLNLLPVGSEEATRFYAKAALEAGSAFVNAIPVFIASDPSGEWPSLYEHRGLPLVGDDVKGQLGATVLHRTLARLMALRGVRLEATYQLNIGGNTDFENMLLEERLSSKRESKTRAVTSVVPGGDEMPRTGRVRIGPSDYVPFLGNTKIAYLYLRGTGFAGFPVEIDVKLKVDDKSMIAGVLIDALRATKVALDRGVAGPVPSVSAPFFKHPPIQAASDEEASLWLEDFLAGRRPR